MPRRVYHHDHTADIRTLLARVALTGGIGLIVAPAGAGVTAVVVGAGDGRVPDGLVRAVWIGVACVGALSVAALAFSLVGWVLYRRRRADLDAQGAEAEGELLAKLANRRRGNRP